MARRAVLIILLTLAVVGIDGPQDAETARVRIGIVGPDEEPRFSALASGLRGGLAEHGHADLDIVEARVPRGDDGAVRAAAQRFAERDVKVAFVIGTEVARVLRTAAPAMPIVFITPGDPVASRLIASLARPGDNLTGMTFEYPDLTAKRLQLLKELMPRARRVLVIADAADASSRQHLTAARGAASRLGLTLVERAVRGPDEVARDLFREVDAFLAIPGGGPTGRYGDILRVAHEARVPTMLHGRAPHTRSALASYGASDVDVAREAARLVDRILGGARAGDLPVERVSRLGLVINLRTAAHLGLMVPPALLLAADEVVE